MTLSDKIEESLSVLQRAFDLWSDSIAIAFSGGKDSLVTLHLIRSLCGKKVPFPVFSIDTTVKFPEIIRFRDELTEKWHLNLIVLQDIAAASSIDIGKDKQACCLALKINPLKRGIVQHNIRGLITAIRWDEQENRTQEQHISPRETPPHTRIHPILHFTESDIWDYIAAFNLPYCELYDYGYRSLSCIPCTSKAREQCNERGGRSVAKEEVMKELRMLGYF